MKLIDLLVKELAKRGGWPEGGTECYWHEGFDVAHFYDTHGNNVAEPIDVDGVEWCGSDGYDVKVTRSQYEAAIAKNDGWIEWGGGKRPVDGTSYVDVKLRSGHVITKRLAATLYWNHYTPNGDGEIMSYRLHRDINFRANDDQLEQDLNECIGQDVVNEWDAEGLPPAGCECEARYCNADNAEWFFFHCVAVDCGVAFGWSGKEAVTLGIDSYEFRPLRTEAEKAREAAETAMRTCLAGTGAGITPMDAKGIYEAIAAGKIPGIKLEKK